MTRESAMATLADIGVRLCGYWYILTVFGHWHQVIATSDAGFFVGKCRACVADREGTLALEEALVASVIRSSRTIH